MRGEDSSRGWGCSSMVKQLSSLCKSSAPQAKFMVKTEQGSSTLAKDLSSAEMTRFITCTK